MSVEREPNPRIQSHTPVLSGNQGREWPAPEVTAYEVGRSQHLGLNSFEVQTCFALPGCLCGTVAFTVLPPLCVTPS